VRASWIILVLVGMVPTCTFYVLDWTGGTEALSYISTTGWALGHPSPKELTLMFLSVITWTWVQGFMNLFLLAAVPFGMADILRSVRAHKAHNAPEPREPISS
jgi:hypothetical protein